MILSLKKTIFLLLFAVFQVLLVFTFATSYELVVVATYILFLSIYFYLFKLRIVLDKNTLAVYLMLLIFSTVSLFFSHHLPLSLESLSFSLAIFLSFSFFHAAFNLNKIKKEYVFLTILLVIFSLSFFFIATFVFSTIANFLPPLNLITLSYGHSHYASFLLFAIPLSWWFYYSEYSQIFRFRWLLIFFFYSLIFFTFSRVTLILSVISFPFLIKKLNLKTKIAFVFITFIALIGILFVSVYSGECPTNELKQQICKPITKEIRPEYFKQSFQAFIDYPVFGYGPGTFQLITEKYGVAGNFKSIYSHNFFLQSFSERGFIVGILFIFLMAIFYKDALFILSSKKKNIEYFLAISFILLFLNSLVDFDWNVFVIFQLSMIIVAGFLKKNHTQYRFITALWYFAAAVIIIHGFFILLFKVLLADDYPNVAAKIFPYVQRHTIQLIKHEDANEQTLSRVMNLYRYDPDILHAFLSLSESNNQKLLIYNQIVDVSPWANLNEQYSELLEIEKKYKELGQVSFNALKTIEIAKQKGYKSRFEVKQRALRSLQRSADFHLGNGDIATAQKYYEIILDEEEWSLHNYKPFFVNEEQTKITDAAYLFMKINISESDFGKNGPSLRVWFANQLIKNISVTNPEDILYFGKFFNEDQFWIFVSEALENTINNSSQEISQEYYLWWYDFWLLMVQRNMHKHYLETNNQHILKNILYDNGELEKAEYMQYYFETGSLR
jgi:O-antigen ligase